MTTSPSPGPATITEHEVEEVQRANATALQPVVFVHGLWLLPSSWDRWLAAFEEAGYTALAPGWPDDPETVEEANANPEVFAHKTVGQVADHFAEIIGGLDRRPAIIGHSFGGLLAQILAGRGRSAATVAIDPAPFRGVLPLPISALKSARPVLGNPANRNRAVPLTYERSASRSPTRSARRRPGSSTRPTRCRRRARRCSRPPRRT
jgi:non-heme chloroperoxidase